MDAKLAHLTTIQGVISRLSNHSFLLKGWSVTLVVALFALAEKDTNKSYIYLAYFPVLMFWILDAYYLGQERRFTDLYDYVRQQPPDNIDFALDTKSFRNTGSSFFHTFFSRTVFFFHGTILVAMIFGTIYL